MNYLLKIMNATDTKSVASANIMSKIRTIPSFIDFSKNQTIDGLASPAGRSTDILKAELFSIKKLIESHDNSINYDRIVGMFLINLNAYQGSIRVTIYSMNSLEDNEKYYFQIEDLPKFLWYVINSDEDVDGFLKLYDQDTNHTLENEKYEKHVRYDLRRNDIFHPIMLERYMITNRYTNNIIYGPIIDKTCPIDSIIKMSPFDLATNYYDILKQYDDVFMLRTTSRYSDSYLEIQITPIGTIADLHYNIETSYSKQIKQINELIDADLNEDLPLDLLLFFLPFSPIGSNYIMKKVKNEQDVCMIHHLNVGLIENYELIHLMKSLYKKQKDGTDNTKNIIKTYITNEYVSIIRKEYKFKQLKTDERIENDNNKTDNETNNDHNNENIMNSVITLMREKGDKKFIDKQFLQRKFL
jgi:hypothetical protein